jgi:hypothetical protein
MDTVFWADDHRRWRNLVILRLARRDRDRHHNKCIRFCHRVATKLNDKQHALAIQSVSAVIVQHTLRHGAPCWQHGLLHGLWRGRSRDKCLWAASRRPIGTYL